MAYINYKDGKKIEITEATCVKLIKRIIERETDLFTVFTCEGDVLFIDVDKIKDIG